MLILLIIESFSTTGSTMALTASDALKQLEQQLTCSVCLDCYTQPRTLPCLHSFCHQCLSHFPVVVEGGSHCITCPVCRQTSQQPDKGVSGYQPAFIINNLLELRELLEKVSESQQDSCETATRSQLLFTASNAPSSSALPVSMHTASGKTSAATRYWV